MTKQAPLVSVIMSTFNDEAYISSSIDSVLTQDFEDFEFIIINDGSTDGTLALLKEKAKQDKRIKIVNQKNQGLVKSLNRGLKLAKGKYIARIDGDDQWLPYKLQTQVDMVLAKPDLVLISGGIEIIDMQDRPYDFFVSSYKDQDIRRIVTVSNPFIHSSAFFDRNSALECGGYPDLCPAEDFALFSNLMQKGQAEIIPYPLIRYRFNNHGISQNNKMTQKKVAEQIALQNWQKFPPKVLPRKQIVSTSKELQLSSIAPSFGESLKHYFLLMNAQIGYRMIKRGHLIKGIQQLLNIASTGRRGFRVVCHHAKYIIKNRLFGC